MYRIQELIPDQKMEDMSGVTKLLPPVTNPTYKSNPNCAVPECSSCHIYCENKISPGVLTQNPVERKDGALALDKYQVGYLLSAD